MSQTPGRSTTSGPQQRPPDPNSPLRINSATGIVLAAVLAVISGGLLLSTGVPALFSVPAGAALALVIPGYALSRAFFIHGLLDRAERAALTIGLSLCVVILGGFALDALPEGLSTHAWAVFLTSVSLAACAIAAVRGGVLVISRQGRGRLPVVPSETPPFPQDADDEPAVSPPAPAVHGIPRAQVAMLALAAILVVGSFLVAQLGVTAQPRPGFTDLWLLPDSAGAAVTVGLTDHEGVTTTYRVVLSVNGRDVNTWSAAAIADGGTWQERYALGTNAATPVNVDVSLYRQADTAPYRQVHLSVDPGSIGPSPTPAASK